MPDANKPAFMAKDVATVVVAFMSLKAEADSCFAWLPESSWTYFSNENRRAGRY